MEFCFARFLDNYLSFTILISYLFILLQWDTFMERYAYMKKFGNYSLFKFFFITHKLFSSKNFLYKDTSI